MRSTFRYSRIASRYCSCLKYRLPRSRYRAFFASGVRAHPARTRAIIRKTVPTRALDDIRVPWLFLLGEIFRQERIQRLDVANQAVGGLRDPAADRSRYSHQRSVGAVADDRAAHHLDLRVQLAGDRLAL